MTQKDWLENFSETVLARMEELNMSRRDLAEISRVPASSVSEYLNKKTMPSIKAIVNFADALEIDCDYLLNFGDTID